MSCIPYPYHQPTHPITSHPINSPHKSNPTQSNAAQSISESPDIHCLTRFLPSTSTSPCHYSCLPGPPVRHQYIIVRNSHPRAAVRPCGHSMLGRYFFFFISTRTLTRHGAWGEGWEEDCHAYDAYQATYFAAWVWIGYEFQGMGGKRRGD